MIPNSFPIPLGGPSFSTTNLPAGGQTSNFVMTEKGLYTITVNFTGLYDNTTSDQVLLNSTTGAANQVGGTNTTQLTITRSGYYGFSVPPGGGTYNFTTTNGANLVAMTCENSGVLGL